MAPAIVSRDVYYPGAKHLVPILQLLIPGIDLVRCFFTLADRKSEISLICFFVFLQNDPAKTVS